MATTKATPTWEDFLAAGKPGERWEYIDGEVRFMSPTGSRHGLLIHEIGLALGTRTGKNGCALAPMLPSR